MAKTAAIAYDVRTRATATNTAWSSPKRFKVGEELVINGLSPGTYDVQARSVSRCSAMSAWTAQAQLVIPLVNQRIGQGNINMLRTGGIGSAWTGFSISYSATPTSATISCTAGTLQDGANNPVYGASSAGVSGTAGSTVDYYLYYDDPAGMGGNLPLGVTTVYSDLSVNQGRVYVGGVSVVYPATGTSSGGGVPTGGGGCVTVDMWLMEGLRAGRVLVGQAIDGATYDPTGMTDRIVESNLIMPQPCLRLISESGCVIEASRSTPMTMPDGSLRMFPNMLGELVLVNDRGDIRWERVVVLDDIGVRPVVLIRMNNQCFFAGAEVDRRVATHNPIAAK